MAFSKYDQMQEQPAALKASRIDADIERVRGALNRIENVTSRIMRCSRSLGYYADGPAALPGHPTPEPAYHGETATLKDALDALEKAVENSAAAISTFE
jgi:hypothetical protein